MSGRRLGRLFGSLLVLATILGGLAVTGVQAIDGGAQMADVVWTMGGAR
ncbi:hypothetical protein GA0070216_103401 [Micromonospora matsumotoense]|uniref:Uncharacterized protein n=1 Tax=Micromonospora matsumotoense TaxID=121616 RepID=A0A1C4WJU9_9ACTN|nr:hypothetical protein [Micromonospora matsumotoense]SCE96444.1 hypothetical protein GA0070216_103401 [Micromonospora matsumotoense]